MYKAIQTELVRIHTMTDVGEDEDIDPQGEQQHFRRRLTQLNEEENISDIELKCYDEEPPVHSHKPGRCITYHYCYKLLYYV